MTTDLQKRVTELVDKGTAEYFAWLRQILTVSSGSLTLLIALRTNFVPADPQYLLLLKLAWVLLALTVTSSLLALGGYHKLILRGASILKQMEETGQHSNYHLDVPQPYRFFGTVVPWAFAASFICLCIFGVANITGPVPPDATMNATADATSMSQPITKPLRKNEDAVQ